MGRAGSPMRRHSSTTGSPPVIHLRRSWNTTPMQPAIPPRFLNGPPVSGSASYVIVRRTKCWRFYVDNNEMGGHLRSLFLDFFHVTCKGDGVLCLKSAPNPPRVRDRL